MLKALVVYAKKPFAGPEVLLRYLTRYTHRVALSNGRLVHLQGDRVTLSYKDYADGCQRKEMTLEAVELLRRFALHILPKGYVRVRQIGLLAHRDRTERLQQCRKLLGSPSARVTVPSTKAATAASEPSAAEMPIPTMPSPTPAGPGASCPLAGKETAAGASPDQACAQDNVATAIMLALMLAATGTLGWLLAVLLAVAETRARKRCSRCGYGWMATVWERARPRGRRGKPAQSADTS
jgi:hypothetical protein